MAAAIMTRWRIPPESSCGYCSYTCCGLCSSTFSSISIARFFRSSFESSVCRRRASSTCQPIFFTGFKEVIGSWNIIPISFPWNLRSVLRSQSRRFTPSNRISPLFFMSFLLRSPAIASALIDFPEPDSPTSPTISPSCKVRSKS